MNSTITNIFTSKEVFKGGIPVAIYSLTGNLDEDHTERIATWFTFKYKIPATAVRFKGKLSLAVATDELLPPEIEEDREHVKLRLTECGYSLGLNNDEERKPIENLIYRSIEQHLRKKYKNDIWLRYRSSRTYCELKPTNLDGKSGVQVYSCFNLFSEYFPSGSIGLILDSTSTLVENHTLFDRYNSMTENEFDSKFSNSWVLLTTERGERKTRFFVGVKQGYNIDSPLIHPFKSDYEVISVRDKYHNTNSIKNTKLSDNEPVAEIRLYKGDESLDYAPLSCLQYTPDLDEIKEENDEISFSEDIYITPEEKYRKIQKYLSYFQDLEFGKYTSIIKLRFNFNSNEASGEFELPDLKFGNGKVIIQKKDIHRNTLKYIKINSLRDFGYYKKPDLEKIIILQREHFDKGLVNNLKSELLKNFKNYSLPFTEQSLEVASGVESIIDLKRLLESTDEEALIGAIVVVEDRQFNYKEVKEVLNKSFIPSQAIREDTLRYLNPRNGKYQGVIQNVIAGIVTKGEGIPWILSKKLSCDMFVGIDSGGPENKRSWASAFVFDGYGEKIHVTSPRYYSKEGIPKEDFKRLILDAAERKFSGEYRNSKLEGITIHRDGFLTKTEREGLNSALNKLQLEDKVKPNFSCISVNVKKGANFRLFSSKGASIENPRMGSYFLLDEKRAFISTTGLPLLTEPTSKPLLAEVDCITGDFEIVNVLRDIFFLSELNWGSPTSTIKLPITTYYADKMIDFADYNWKPTYLPI